MSRRTPNLHRFRLDGEEFVAIVSPLAPEPALLSEAELAVARLAACGATNAEIAELRSVSERTVANQIARVLAKLGVSRRYQLAAALPSRGT